MNYDVAIQRCMPGNNTCQIDTLFFPRILIHSVTCNMQIIRIYLTQSYVYNNLKLNHTSDLSNY